MSEWQPGLFNGMRVIQSAALTQQGDPYKVRRTWLERLFSLPWHPLTATRIIVPQVPYRGAVQVDQGTLVMHPKTWRQLLESLPDPPAAGGGRRQDEEKR